MKLFACVFCLAVSLFGQFPDDSDKPRRKSKKKDIEPVTQTLPLPKDLPGAVTVETDRLVMFTSPLSGKGLLTAQTREALKYLIGAASKNATMVKLRVFVAGSGDTRRIQTLVSEIFTEKRLNLPALTTVQVGSLGVDGAQVLIQATSLDRRSVNPNGVAFISGQVGKTHREALDHVRKAIEAAGATEAIGITCFVSSLEEADKTVPGVTTVQMRREPSPTAAECEAVARLAKAPAGPVVLLNPEGLTKSENYSQIALVNAPKIVLSGLQMSFQGADPKLAFERLGRALEAQGSGLGTVFFTNTYALSQQAIEQVRGTRFQYVSKERPPASTLLPFEGLPSLDATFGLEVVAVAK